MNSQIVLRILLVASVLLTPGCQSGKTVSLDEAKELTATFDAREFEPPPRSTRDLVDVLTDNPGERPSIYAMYEAIADQPISRRGSDYSRSDAYYRRALAAARIGRDQQFLSDMRRSVDLVRSSSIEPDLKLLATAGTAEFLAGEPARSAALFAEVYESTEGRRQYSKTMTAGFLTHLYARMGNLPRAEQYLALVSEHWETHALTERMWYHGQPADGKWSSPSNEYWKKNLAGFHVFGANTTAVKNFAHASLASASGRFAESERYARDGIASLEAAKETARANFYYQPLLSGLREQLVLSLVRQHRLAEAEVEARKSIRLFAKRAGPRSLLTATALVDSMIPVIIEQARFEDVEWLAGAAMEIYSELGVPESSLKPNLARAAIADSLAYRARWTESLALYDSIRDSMASSSTFKQLVTDRLTYDLVLARAGRAGEAVERLSKSVRELTDRDSAGELTVAEIRGIYAIALARAGNRPRAAEEFDDSVSVLIASTPFTLDFSTAQTHRVRIIFEAYVDFLGDEYSSQPAPARKREIGNRIFEIAEAARAQRVQRALSASAARAAARDSELADLARREQTAHRQVAALYRALAELEGGQRDGGGATDSAKLVARITEMRQARLTLLDEIESRFPRYAELINPKSESLSGVKNLLQDDEALLATYSTEFRTYVWAVSASTEPSFAMSSMGRDALAAQVGLVLEALHPREDTLGEIPDFDVAAGFELYAELLQPLEATWGPSKSLVAITHGPLAQLPLSILPTSAAPPGPEVAPLFSNYRNVRWLARSYPVTRLPSAASLKTLRKTRHVERAATPFVGFGDPMFSAAETRTVGPSPGNETTNSANAAGSRRQSVRVARRATPKTRSERSADLSVLPRLPDTSEEIRAMAMILGGNLSADVFLRARATEDAVKSGELSDRRIVAFATHGLVPGDLDGLTQPALAFSSPDIVGGVDDGLLTMGEILGLTLNADLVVLSACNTAAADGEGAEAVSGLGRAFFYAGARSLLVSNWPVESTSARLLTTRMLSDYAKKPSMSLANAARRAMLELIDEREYVDGQGRAVFSYAHPIFWGPFSFFGENVTH